jgi:aryl-alcohol dehydrogenase-like predicted oxidoreductase
MSIVLGTAQFGLNYGVSNKVGKTKNTEVKRILEYAFNNGIKTLDTAAYYGDSERVIGSCICKDFGNNDWSIITKTPVFKCERIESRQINELLKSFKLSQQRIGQNKLYGLLIHSCDNLFLPGGEKLLQTINNLKEDGFVKKIGVSAYSGLQIDRILDNYSIDLIQIPVNILDQRLISGGYLKKLNKYGVEIHARSVFLQGLLLMPIDDLPPWFDSIAGILKRFHIAAEKINISALELALNFVQNIYDIDSVVVGVNRLEQLCNITNSKSLQFDIEKFSYLSIEDESILNPSNWKT